MQTRTDAELLRDYAAHRSETAFGEIVRRYADFVYSAALRQVGDAEQARDVAQTVFADLARKAGSLRANAVLIGWLCQGARLAALEQHRKDRRRLQRERQAMELLDSAPEFPDDWNGVRPVLDEAIATLNHQDRDALLLRFFRNESLSSVGATLGVSEDAAQKRVSRALEKLREFFAERGIKTTAAALSAALIANGVQAAPAGFAGTLAAGALADAGAVGSAAPAIMKWLGLAKMKTAVPIVALGAGVIGLTVAYFHLQGKLRDARALAEQRAAAASDLRAATEQLANLSNELDQLRGDARDLLRLRAEVTRLGRDRDTLQKLLRSQVSASETNAVEEETNSQINIKIRCVTVPSRLFQGETTGILTDPQFRQIVQSLQKPAASASGEESILTTQQGQVTTLSGRQAEIQMRLAHSTANDEPGLDLAFGVLATRVGNSSVISLDFAQVSLLKFESAGQAAVAPTVTPDSPIVAVPGPGNPGVVVVPHYQPLFQFTNSLSIPDGQTLMVARKLPRSEDSARAAGTASVPETVLIFVTPTLIDPAGNRLYVDDASQSPTPSTNVVLPGQTFPADGLAAEPH